MHLVHFTLRNLFFLFQLALLFYGELPLVYGNLKPKRLQQNTTYVSTSSSLFKTISPRQIGCWNKPWICRSSGEFHRRRRMRCCRNRCVDVSSDVENCGLCGIRCPFTWKCCHSICINTNISPFHCGRCERRCHFPSFCFYGICGYAQPLPPFPFPPRPPKPYPPKPPRPYPPKPFPPPKPYPPKPFPPPKPYPPKPFPPQKPYPPKPFPPPKPYPSLDPDDNPPKVRHA